MARFVYYNRNPEGETIEDCVCRAISLATALPYEEIDNLLWESADYLNCDRLHICCYTHLLDDYFGFEQVDCEGMTVEEFADMHPFGIYLARIEGHLSCIIAGDIYDIWDCRKEILTNVWKV